MFWPAQRKGDCASYVPISQVAIYLRRGKASKKARFSKEDQANSLHESVESPESQKGLLRGWTPPHLRELYSNPEYGMLMMAATTFFLMSILIHFPLWNNSPLYYSDIVDTFWYERASSAGIPLVVTGIPYVSYFFEYPPVCGLILWLGGWASGGNVLVFASVEFGVVLAFFLLLTHFTYLFAEYLGLNHTRQLIFSIFAPSILFYGAYNYDLVQTFFVIASLYFFIAKPRYDLSALFLGLSVATKLSPAFLLPLFWQEMNSNYKRARYTAIAATTVIAANLPFILANYGLWIQSYQYLAGWGLEDSFMVWIFPQNEWPIAKDLSLILIVLSAAGIYMFLKSKPLISRAMLITGAFILFSYISAPQLNLDLLPFFALLPMVPISLFYLFEVTDVLVIVTWFLYQNPTLPGLSQTFALLRQIYLALILGLTALSKTKLKS